MASSRKMAQVPKSPFFHPRRHGERAESKSHATSAAHSARRPAMHISMRRREVSQLGCNVAAQSSFAACELLAKLAKDDFVCSAARNRDRLAIVGSFLPFSIARHEARFLTCATSQFSSVDVVVAGFLNQRNLKRQRICSVLRQHTRNSEGQKLGSEVHDDSIARIPSCAQQHNLHLW